MRTAPKWPIGLSHFELLCRKPLITVDLLLVDDYNNLLNYSHEAALIHKLLNKYTECMLPKSDLTVTKSLPHASPRRHGLYKRLEVKHSRGPKLQVHVSSYYVLPLQ